MNQDRRILRTEKSLYEGLMFLLQEKPIHKITVKKLCQLADINRSTFYQHYDNPVAMLTEIEGKLFADLQHYLAQNTFQNTLDTMLATTRYLASHKAQVKILILANGKRSPNLADLLSAIYQNNIDQWKSHFPEMDDIQINYLFKFIIEGSQGIIMSWIEAGFLESPEYIADLTAALCASLFRPEQAKILR